MRVLTTISGVLVITMALVLAGSLVLRAPGLYREVRFHPHLGRRIAEHDGDIADKKRRRALPEVEALPPRVPE